MVSLKFLVVLALIAASLKTTDAAATTSIRLRKANCGIGTDGFLKGLGSVFNGFGGSLNIGLGIFGNLLQPIKPSGFSSSIDLTVDLSLGCGKVLDRTLIGGLGRLLAKIYIAISKITVCILGPANCKVCQGTYYGIGPVKAKAGISVFLEQNGLLDCKAQLQALIEKRSKRKGITYFSPSQQVVLNAGLKLADILSVNIGKQDLTKGLVQLSIVAGAIGTTRSKKDGTNISGGLVDTLNAHLEEQNYTVITVDNYETITSTIARCNNDKGAFDKVTETENVDDDNTDESDDDESGDDESGDGEGGDDGVGDDESGDGNGGGIEIRVGAGLGGLGNVIQNLFGVLKGTTNIVGSAIQSLLNFKNPTNFDESVTVSVQLFQGFGSLLDVSFIKGLGSLVVRIFVLISKITICLLGKVNCSLCNTNYAGIGQISGDISAVIKTAGLSNCNQDIKNLIYKKSNGKGITSFTVAEQIVLNNILDLSLLLNAKISKQTLTSALKIGITIFGSIGNSYSVQDKQTGDNIVSGVVDVCGKYLTKQGFSPISRTDVSVIISTVGRAKQDNKAAWCVKK